MTGEVFTWNTPWAFAFIVVAIAVALALVHYAESRWPGEDQ